MSEEIKTAEVTVPEKEAPKAKAEKGKVDIKKWRNRVLAVCNNMSNKAKAQKIAQRVLRAK